MKKLMIFVLAFFMGTSLFAQQINQCAVGKQSLIFKYNSSLMKMQYPGDDSYDVTYYLLNLKVTYSPRQISGNVIVNGKSIMDGFNQFFLDLQDNLILDSVRYKNEVVQTQHVSDKLIITLSDTLNTGDEFSVDVYYHGVPGSSGFGSFEFSTHNGHPVIWTLSEPYGASDWFPVKDTPADKADSSDVWITVDSSMVGVSNGKLVETLNNGDGTKTYKWKNHYPIAQYLISLAISNYDLYLNQFVYNDGKDSMDVAHYVFPENLTASTKAQMDKTVEMIGVFSEKFGLYPFIKEKYGHAMFKWGGGMEHQTATSIGSFGRDLVSHELAHQWFGDMITCADWHHIWLNEGFATYLEAVYLEAISGFGSYKAKIAGEMNSAKNARGSIWVQNINSVGEIFSGSRSYAKGAVVLHMLRGVLGDEKFWQTMYEYANDPELKYGVAVTEDFQRVAERVSGMDLDYFFQEWIYGEMYPKYSVEWGYGNNGDGTYTVDFTIIQERRGTPRFFTMPVQITLKSAAGDTTFTVFNNGVQEESFSIVVKNQPARLDLDPNDWILKELNTVRLVSSDDAKIKPVAFSLEQNYPNPFNPTTTIKYSVPSQLDANTAIPMVQLSVYDVLGRKVATLVNERKLPGKYSVEFNVGEELSSGIYFYTLRIGDMISTKKMTLLK